jgi:hypothetical protein
LGEAVEAADRATAQVSGEQLEHLSVPGADDTKVAVIESCDLRDPMAFGRGDHRGVHAAKRQIVVAGDELRHPEQISRVDGLKCEVAGGEVSEKADLGLPAEAGREQIDDLGDHEGRDEQRTLICLEQFATRCMVGIIGVDVGVERT